MQMPPVTEPETGAPPPAATAVEPADRSRALHARRSYDIAAYILAGLALLYVLKMKLLPALLAGLLVHELVHMLAPRIPIGRGGRMWAKIIVVFLLTVVIVGLMTWGIVEIIDFFQSGGGNLPALLRKMAESIDAYRHRLPAWLSGALPSGEGGLRVAVMSWVKTHASELQLAGKQVGVTLGYIIIGMIIGAMISLREVVPSRHRQPLARALGERAKRLGTAFRRVVFAQVRIAAVNTAFTAFYLAIALPAFGIDLPLTKTLIAVTFFCGLLPVIGNLISNTVIFLVSLNYSLPVAIASLCYLIVIHKLEYFLNARIIGSRISTRAWELLLAMLVMEVAFGAAGVIAAPIYYAYLKDELSHRGLV